MSTWEKRREEQRKYEGDVQYDVWRRGGNPDRINNERVNDHFWNGDYYEKAASDELRRQRPKPPEPDQEVEE